MTTETVIIALTQASQTANHISVQRMSFSTIEFSQAESSAPMTQLRHSRPLSPRPPGSPPSAALPAGAH
jgi:hypothetical protein